MKSSYSAEQAKAEIARRQAARQELQNRGISPEDKELLSRLTQNQQEKDENVKSYNEKMSQPAIMNPSNYAGKQGTIPINELAMIAPMGQAANLLPKGASWLAKAAANYGGAIGQNAAIGGGLSAIEGESPLHGAMVGGGLTAGMHPLITAAASGNPLTRMIAAGTLGSGLAYGLHHTTGIGSNPTDIAAGVIGAGLSLKGKNARDAAIYKQLRGVKPEDANGRLAAAGRLGLDYLTPAEATGLPYVGAAQGSIGKSQEGSELLFHKANSRLKSEEKAIDNLLTTIGRKAELAPEIKTLYQSSYGSSVSPKYLQELKKSAIVKKAFENVNKEPAYQDQLQHLFNNKDGSAKLNPTQNFQYLERKFEYLDQVKRAMDDMADAALRKGQNNKARLITQKKNELLDHMDSISPDYKKARDLSQRYIVAENLAEKMNTGKVTGSNFYRKFISNKNTFQEIRDSLKNAPNAQKQLDDMKLAFEHLIGQDSARAGTKLEKTSMTKSRSSGQYWNDFLHKVQGGAYDKASINLITDPKWAKELGKIKDMNSNNKKTQAIANLLTKAAVVSPGMLPRKQMMQLDLNQYAGEQ